MTNDALRLYFCFAFVATVLVAEAQSIVAAELDATRNPRLLPQDFVKPSCGFKSADLIASANADDNAEKASAAAFLSSGRSKFAEGNYQQALDDLDQSINIDPNNSLAYYSRAFLFRHKGQNQKAREDWLRALSLDPSLGVGRLGTYQNVFEMPSPGLEKSDANNNLLSIEKSVAFVDAGDAFAKEFITDSEKLDSWSPGDKRFFLQVLANIQRKCPELISKACNGKEIRLLLSRGAIGINSMDTSPVRVMCFPLSLRFTPRELEWALTHEFAHIIDTSQVLSDGKEWRAVYSPYRSRYLAVEKDISSIKFDVMPSMSSWGLPSSYAALDATEGLAECVAATVVADWVAPQDLKTYIQDRIIARDSADDQLRSGLRQVSFDAAARKYKSVLEDADTVLSANPSVAAAFRAKGKAYLNLGELQKAIDCFDRTITLVPDDAMSFAGRGGAFHKMMNYQNAVADYDRAIALDAKQAETYSNRGSAHMGLKQYQNALNDYTKAIELSPGIASNYSKRAGAFIYLGDVRKALADFDKAISLNADDYNSLLSRAAIYNNLGQFQNALTDCNTAAALKDTDKLLFLARGTAYAGLDEPAKAVDDFSKAIALSPKQANLYASRGQSYEKLGQFDNALSDYKTAVSLNPSLVPDLKERIDALSAQNARD